jgi:hypothetical protein
MSENIQNTGEKSTYSVDKEKEKEKQGARNSLLCDYTLGPIFFCDKR